MTYITGKTYAFLAVLIVVLLYVFPFFMLSELVALLFPVGLAQDLASIVAVLFGFTGSLLLLLWVWKSSSSPDMSFLDGLAAISDRLMSGCFPLTMLYIFPILFIVYTIAVFHTVVGLVKGKAHARERWIGLVSWFRNLRPGH